jgi:hypothetical protein
LTSTADSLPVAIHVVSLSSKELITQRTEILSAEATATLMQGLALQKERGLDSLLELEKLGDQKEFVRFASQPGIPPIHEIVVNEDERTTNIRADLTVSRVYQLITFSWILTGSGCRHHAACRACIA